MSVLVLVEITGGSEGLTLLIDRKDSNPNKEENDAAIWLCTAIKNTLVVLKEKNQNLTSAQYVDQTSAQYNRLKKKI